MSILETRYRHPMTVLVRRFGQFVIMSMDVINPSKICNLIIVIITDARVEQADCLML